MLAAVPGQGNRQWIAKLLAIWMFVYAANAVLFFFLSIWPAMYLGRQGLAAGTPWHESRPWVLALLALEQIILDILHLLPTPDLLPALRMSVIAALHLTNWALSLRQVALVTALLVAMAAGLGVGLLRGREWARWSYASLCLVGLMLVALRRLMRWPWGHSFTLFGLIAFLAELIMPVVLLIFLLRRGPMVTVRTQPVDSHHRDV